MYVIAIEPEDRFKKLIEHHKDEVKLKAGEQIYRTHPPHVTIFALSTDKKDELFNIISDLSKETEKLTVTNKSLNVFYDDKQTNAHTIFYEFTDEQSLRELQNKLINALKLINKTNNNFPYQDGKWLPHLTIASVEREKFDEVYKKLKGIEIHGDFMFDTIAIYSYVYPHQPIVMKRFQL